MSLRAVDSDSVNPESARAAAPGRKHPLDVAIVIVTYKSAQMTIECLRSLVSERSTPGLHIRVVVVDNASGDIAQILRVVEECNWSSWVTLVSAPRNGGFAYGNNLGIECAYASSTPSYIHLLNPDTQVRPGAIGSLVRFMEGHPEAGIAGNSYETGEGGDWPIAFRFPSMMGELIQGLDLGVITRLLERWANLRYMGKNDSVPVDWISGASMMIRPEVFAAIGGMDENYFLFYEETDFCTRARRAGISTWYVPESRIMHIGGHSTSVSSRVATRLPSYWFESRRRYFAVTHGVVYAVATDIVAVIAHFLGSAKRLVQRRQYRATPYFIRDLVRHSALWTRNRDFPPVRSRIPGAKGMA